MCVQGTKCDPKESHEHKKTEAMVTEVCHSDRQSQNREKVHSESKKRWLVYWTKEATLGTVGHGKPIGVQ
ncbi:hypothetical protein Poly51_11640 [Rubripirellula tenax]|uniref:Uncharacterized protein n=1 Tax=Rubripirellula tenax TaxID=2528015 RepID=A0A5C6FMY7_9BACT|nr:hypothetical protein Poly51_11640 [Rubripirellula tenax]